MSFLRFFIGYLGQVAPIAFLALHPFRNNLRLSKQKLIGLGAVFLPGLAAAYSGACCWLQNHMPPGGQRYTASNLVFLLTVAFCAALYFWIVQARWQKKLFVFTFCLTSAYTIVCASSTIFSPVLFPADHDGLPYWKWGTLVLFASTAAAFPFLLLVINRFYKPEEDSVSPREEIHLSVMTLLLFLTLFSGFSFLSYDDFNFHEPVLMFLFIALHISIIMLYVVIFRIIILTREKITAQAEADQARSALTLQAEQYRRIRGSIESSRRRWHDLRHHMVVIQRFLQNDEIEQTKKYVDGYMENAARREWSRLCGNDVVNTVVGHYQSLAAERNIAFTARIAIPDRIGVSDADISVLIGNLLENAIEAAEKVTEEYRYIRLNIICSGKMLAITVDNGFNGVVSMDGGQYLSTKAQHRGVGMQSIEHIIGKYDGGIELAHEDHAFHFSGMLGMKPE